MVQKDLDGNEIQLEVTEVEETKRVHKLAVGYFYIQITPEAWRKLLEFKKKEREADRPLRIKRWVQVHARAFGGKKPIDKGAFDRDTDALFNRIMEGEQ